jgi:hypothetical protein
MIYSGSLDGGGERKANAMSALPLRTPCLCVKFSALSCLNRRQSTVSFELALPLKKFAAALTRPVELKSFICNAYKKHGGLEAESEANAIPALPLRTPGPYFELSPLSLPICWLLAVSCKPPLPLKNFSSALTCPVELKSFICNAYKKHGGVGDYAPRLVRHSPCGTAASRSNAHNSNLFMRLLHDSLDTGGVGVCLPPSPLRSRVTPP